LAQRYYFERNVTTVGYYASGAGQILYLSIDTPVTMRTAATTYPITGTTNANCTIATAGATPTDIRVDITSTVGGQNYSVNGIIKASAEL
jgi:hypothetical protein